MCHFLAINVDCYTGDGHSYLGKISQTISGKTCQRWGHRKPQKHEKMKPGQFPENSVKKAKNYCRNPDHSQQQPWCYTMDENTRLEVCQVQKCGKLK